MSVGELEAKFSANIEFGGWTDTRADALKNSATGCSTPGTCGEGGFSGIIASHSRDSDQTPSIARMSHLIPSPAR